MKRLGKWKTKNFEQDMAVNFETYSYPEGVKDGIFTIKNWSQVNLLINKITNQTIILLLTLINAPLLKTI